MTKTKSRKRRKGSLTAAKLSKLFGSPLLTTTLKPKLLITISPRMNAYLAALVTTGLFGSTMAEAARRILEEWLWNNAERIQNLGYK